MAQEIELKLAIPDDAASAALVRWLDANGQRDGDFALTNVYLDTPQRELAAARAALRLRRHGGQWLQTLKSAGESRDGLATRQEWETPVSAEAIELERLPEAARSLLAPLYDRLQPVFRTDFRRRTWRIGFDGAQIEAALDLGEITAPGRSAREPIHELELEFLSGNVADAGQALRSLAGQLQAVAQITPSDRSKAARGYALAGLPAAGER